MKIVVSYVVRGLVFAIKIFKFGETEVYLLQFRLQKLAYSNFDYKERNYAVILREMLEVHL